MKTRAAIDFEYRKPMVVEEVELPDPGPSDVLVRLFVTGICHSQLHQLHSDAAARPAMMGHEATGVVEALGRDVTHVKKGDHVMVTWVPRDITEEAYNFRRSRAIVRGGEINPGIYTWAEHVLCHEQMVVGLDKDLPVDVTAIIGCATITGVGAVLGSAQVKPGETVAVFGVGGVGVNVLAGARIAEASRIIAVDLDDGKLEFSKEFGATDTVNAKKTDPVQAIKDLTGGGVDYAFDAIGMELVLNQCIEATKAGVLGVRRGGTTVSVGIPQGPVTLKPRLFPMGERSLIGSLGGSCRPQEEFPRYLQWFRDGLLPLDKMISKRYDSLDDINEGIRALEKGEISGRSILNLTKP